MEETCSEQTSPSSDRTEKTSSTLSSSPFPKATLFHSPTRANPKLIFQKNSLGNHKNHRVDIVNKNEQQRRNSMASKASTMNVLSKSSSTDQSSSSPSQRTESSPSSVSTIAKGKKSKDSPEPFWKKPLPKMKQAVKAISPPEPPPPPPDRYQSVSFEIDSDDSLTSEITNSSSEEEGNNTVASENGGKGGKVSIGNRNSPFFLK